MSEKMECYISLGANLGKREQSLRKALEMLHSMPGVELCSVSGFFATAPWGKTDQPFFVNAAAKLRTELTPIELLETCHRVEDALGRVRHEHWGARTLDIDLLYIPGVTSDTADLRLPHPYMLERAFVLVPLQEIAPNLRIGGRTVREHTLSCADPSEVRPCPGSPMDASLKLIAYGGEGRWGEREEGPLSPMLEDTGFFRRKTWGQTVIMGQRTMEFLGQPLEGRRNIVLSRQRDCPQGFVRCEGLEDLWQALSSSSSEHYVIGGRTVYQQLLPYCREKFLIRSPL